jgi:DNA mismatch repair protein MutS
MMQQYNRMKAEHPGTILFFRMGDFYETFGDDAVITARVLEITLTTRGKVRGEKMPLAGIPYHALDAYLHRMVKAGYRVAICEQVEDPKKAKGLVRREVVRIVSPGTVMEDSMLKGRANNFLVAVHKGRAGYGLAAADISTGELLATELAGASAERVLRNEVAGYVPAEVLVDPEIGCAGMLGLMGGELSCALTLGTRSHFDRAAALETLLSALSDVPGTVPDGLAAVAAGAALAYLSEMQKGNLGQMRALKLYATEDFMVLDPVTLRNLELFSNIRDGGKAGTLFDVMDRTLTPMGTRALRAWMSKPLMDPEAIGARLDAVEFLLNDRPTKAESREALRCVSDLERLVARSLHGSANARDLEAVGATLCAVPAAAAALGGKAPGLLVSVRGRLDPCAELVAELRRAIAEGPPVGVREGGMIREGYDPALDELRDMASAGGKWMAGLEEAERARTGIKALKIRYNRVFGYFIEVPAGQAGKVPADYIKKQTLANAERFFTPELKEKEGQILTANERSTALEYEIFCRLRDMVCSHAERLRGTAGALGELDAIASLAELAAAQGYTRPRFDGSDAIAITEGRHPVVEALMPGSFVPNDTLLDMRKNRVIILTGPNMAGKSTYMRQVALIVLMAQTGSFVPARAARLGLTDRIFTRVGAFDDLSRGQSTFMVEMTQVADILRNATRRSLILLDELGRGTSTFDGLSIAWAVAEYIHSRKVGAKTIFATHYHQLNELEELLDGVANHNIAVKEERGGIIFLRKVIPGSTNRSYGVEVARLAGMPPEVVERAGKLLSDIEAQTVMDISGPKPGRKKPRTYTQLVMFGGQEEDPVLGELRALNPDHMTPMQALQKLQELKKRLEAGK